MLQVMTDLILYKETMSSLEIAELTGKRHDAILRDIRNLLNQGVNAHNFVEVEYTDKKGEKRPCYELTKKGCLILASGYDAKLREKIIDRWEELERDKQNGNFQTPSTYIEALEALVASEKEKERMRIESEQQKKQIEQKDAKIAKIQPKADFADKAFAMEGKCDIGQAAKILGLPFGRNTLFKKLREAGVFFANRNEPKQKYIDAGYFEMKEKPIPRDNHPGFVVMVVLCAQKGLAYINYLFGGKITVAIRNTNKKTMKTIDKLEIILQKMEEQNNRLEQIYGKHLKLIVCTGKRSEKVKFKHED